MHLTCISRSSQSITPEDVHLEVQDPFMQPRELPRDPTGLGAAGKAPVPHTGGLVLTEQPGLNRLHSLV